MMTCTACGREFVNLWDQHAVCMPCVKARHRAAVTHRCACRGKLRRPRQCRTGSRVWITCDRCLGTVRQVA